MCSAASFDARVCAAASEQVSEQMVHREWSVLHHDPALRLNALHAVFTTHAFARHWHDYYVIGLVDAGVQSFSCRRGRYLTPQGGLILLNPGDAHTGEVAASTPSFTYRALYPTATRLAALMAELGRPDELPNFPSARVDDTALAAEIRLLHAELGAQRAPIARETRWLAVLTTLITRYGAERLVLPIAGAEPRAVAFARAYLEAHATEPVTLAEVAAQVGLSPFHLVRRWPPAQPIEGMRCALKQRSRWCCGRISRCGSG